MKKQLPKYLARCLLSGICLVLAACERPGDPSSAETKAFADAFRQANRAEDISPMLDLYHLDGVEKRTIRMLEQALQFELGLPVESIDFEPLSGAPEECIDFTREGVHYGPSLRPSLRMRVVYSVEDRFTSLFTLGRRPDGEWRIVCARPRQNADLSAAVAPR